MGRQDRDQGQLSCEFSLDEMIPTDHLLRRINGFATPVLADLRERRRLETINEQPAFMPVIK
jgi:hypothetical protein